MYDKVVQTTNLKALMVVHDTLLKVSRGMPRMAIVHGDAGMGKTTALRDLAGHVGAIRVDALPIWTANWMLSDIVRAMGGAGASRSQPMYEFITSSLARSPRPLIIDEADHIARRDILVETLRAIHDATNVPILLVGMAEFKRRASQRKQLYRRIIREVEFLPATAADARLLADELCEVRCDDDLIVRIHHVTGGSVGLICNKLEEVETFARRHQQKQVTAAQFFNESARLAPIRAVSRDA